MKVSELKHLLFKEELIPMSWGLKEINIIGDSLSFHVFGLKFEGEVILTQCDQGFNIKFYHNNQMSDELQLISSDSLVRAIDDYVEYSDNYAESVLNRYCK